MLINGLVVSGLRVVSDFATLNYEGAPIKRLRTLRVAVKLRTLSLSLSLSLSKKSIPKKPFSSFWN